MIITNVRQSYFPQQPKAFIPERQPAVPSTVIQVDLPQPATTWIAVRFGETWITLQGTVTGSGADNTILSFKPDHDLTLTVPNTDKKIIVTGDIQIYPSGVLAAATLKTPAELPLALLNGRSYMIRGRVGFGEDGKIIDSEFVNPLPFRKTNPENVSEYSILNVRRLTDAGDGVRLLQLEGVNKLLVPYAGTPDKTLTIMDTLRLRTTAAGVQILGLTLSTKSQPIILPTGDTASVNGLEYAPDGSVAAATVNGPTKITLQNKQTVIVQGTVHFTPQGYPTGELTLAGENNRYTVAGQTFSITDTLLCSNQGTVTSFILDTPTEAMLPDRQKITIGDEVTLTPQGGFATVHAAVPVNETVLGQKISVKDLTYDEQGKIRELVYNIPTAQTIPGYGTIQAYKVTLTDQGYIFEALQLPELDLATQTPVPIRITTTLQGDYVSQETPNR